MVVVSSLGTCRVFDIASALAITVGGASKLVDRVEAAGYCSRKMNPGDRRSSLLDLTEEGKAVVARGRQVIEAELDSWFTPALSQTGDHHLLDLLVRLRSAQRPRWIPRRPAAVSGGTMRAVVLDGPGPAEALVIRERPIPVPGPARCSSGSGPSGSTARNCIRAWAWPRASRFRACPGSKPSGRWQTPPAASSAPGRRSPP